MVLDGGFWAGYFEKNYCAYLRLFTENVHAKLLPTFDNIADEAEALSVAEFNRLGSLPGTGYEDMGDAADTALDAGIIHYQILADIKQGLLNMFAASLYHLFEQQMMFFHRRQVLAINEEADDTLFKMHIMQERLRSYKIDVKVFDTWEKIEELRLVANTVKHAEGDSSKKLRKIRPDMFVHPVASQFEMPVWMNRNSPIYAPMSGDDFYVSVTDFNTYSETLLRFWNQLGEALMTTEL